MNVTCDKERELQDLMIVSKIVHDINLLQFIPATELFHTLFFIIVS